MSFRNSHHGAWGLSHERPRAASRSFVDLRHDGIRPRSDGLNQIPRPHQLWQSTAITELAPDRVRRSCGLCSFEPADLAISKAVVDEGQELPGHGHPCLVLGPALGDASVVGLQLLVAAYPVVPDRFDGRQRTRGDPCLSVDVDEGMGIVMCAYCGYT
jgi:hypothetical protein